MKLARVINEGKLHRKLIVISVTMSDMINCRHETNRTECHEKTPIKQFCKRQEKTY